MSEHDDARDPFELPDGVERTIAEMLHDAQVERRQRLEHAPSAVASISGIRRGPVIACQSQYDPDE